MSLKAEMQREVILNSMDTALETRTKELFGKTIKDSTNEELYLTLLSFAKDMMKETDKISGDK